MQAHEQTPRSAITTNAIEIVLWGAIGDPFASWSSRTRQVRTVCLPSLRLLDLPVPGNGNTGDAMYLDLVGEPGEAPLHRQAVADPSWIEAFIEGEVPVWTPVPAGHVRYLRFAVPRLATARSFSLVRAATQGIAPFILLQRSLGL